MAATDSSLIEPSTMSRPVGLFDLPGELKNAIYRFALVETQHLDITTKSIPLEPALLRTCRVIRQEARSIFYLENTFRILSHNGDMVPVLKFCAQHHLIEDGIRILVTRENLSSRDDFGSSKLDNEIDYIGAWYSREVLMHPCQTNSHYVKDGRLRSPGVRHRLWVCIFCILHCLILF